MRRRSKRTTVWAYLDGKKLVDVVQAALAAEWPSGRTTRRVWHS